MLGVRITLTLPLTLPLTLTLTLTLSFTGMISFRIRGNLANAQAFLKAVKIFTLAESLGAVESLCEHP